MSKINVLREIFGDIKYRASQKGFDIETKFDNERSAIQVIRRLDKSVIYRLVEEVDKNVERKFLKTEVLKTQIKVYEHFISYMSFYGIFTVAYSHDEEQKEIAEKEKKEKEKKKDA